MTSSNSATCSSLKFGAPSRNRLVMRRRVSARFSAEPCWTTSSNSGSSEAGAPITTLTNGLWNSLDQRLYTNLRADSEGRVSPRKRPPPLRYPCKSPGIRYISSVKQDTLITERVLRVGPLGPALFCYQNGSKRGTPGKRGTRRRAQRDRAAAYRRAGPTCSCRDHR